LFWLGANLDPDLPFADQFGCDQVFVRGPSEVCRSLKCFALSAGKRHKHAEFVRTVGVIIENANALTDQTAWNLELRHLDGFAGLTTGIQREDAGLE
jgi:hypothetical protein